MTLDFDWVSKKIFWHTGIRKILGIFTFEENPYSKPMGGGRGKTRITTNLKKIAKSFLVNILLWIRCYILLDIIKLITLLKKLSDSPT